MRAVLPVAYLLLNFALLVDAHDPFRLPLLGAAASLEPEPS
jgi:hypothetical protein